MRPLLDLIQDLILTPDSQNDYLCMQVEYTFYQYQVGSSLPPNAPTYVVRQADQDFYEGLRAGEFCYVLNSRQMGKSSLRVQTMQRLLSDGIACAAIDITQIGSQEVTLDQWYATLVKILADSFQIPFKLSPWWRERELLSPLQRFSEFIEQVLLTAIAQNIVIFVDEIDSVLSLKFSTDDFFAFIRACYNQRVDKPEYQRLTFALLGVATPSDLIQDKRRTPFNIGRAIQLNGFHLSEAQPLAQGLVGRVINPTVVLKEILAWTGGQPFLTQKLCQLVLTFKSPPIIAGGEAECVDKLVHSQVIENWESQDHPEHLKTIRDRILSKKQLNGRILELYKQILQQSQVAADESLEQMELRLSGLVVKQQGSLSVYNRIYESVFNQSWVDKALSALRPYAEALQAWVASNYQDESRLLRGQALQDALVWAADKKLGDLDFQFLAASQELSKREIQLALKAREKALEIEKQANKTLAKAQQKAKRLIRIGFAIFAMSLVVGIGVIIEKLLVEQEAAKALQNRISLGNKILVMSNSNPNKEAGVQAFASGDFDTAIDKFQISLQRNHNDPETLIYLNNAKVGKDSTLRIAVSVPVGSNLNVAQEILRGVAQTQEEVNHSGGIKGKLLQVEIANDDNDPDISKQLAAEFVADKNILAVVGHNASDASVPAAQVYQRGGLVMISPTSFAKGLSNNNDYIFRAVPSIGFVTDTLAKYTVKTARKTRIVICSDFKAKDNQSFGNEFTFALYTYGGKFINIACDFSAPGFNPSAVISQAISAGADGLLLAPHVDRIEKAIELAQANKGQLALFSSPTLNTFQTLQSGRANVNGLVLAVPWHPAAIPGNPFVNNATKLWGGAVNWRTAMAYDATQAIVTGLKQSNTRDGLLHVLHSPSFSAFGATGTIQFLPSGDRNGKAVLVQIQPSSQSVTGYNFVPLMSRHQ